MRAGRGKLGALLLIWSLLASLAVPYLAASQPFDADAHGGPPVPAEHATPQFESPHAALPSGHCLLCHWWSSIKTGDVSSSGSAMVLGPVLLLAVTTSDCAPASFVSASPSPRGPPAIS
jgi:hypothetical protein